MPTIALIIIGIVAGALILASIGTLFYAGYRALRRGRRLADRAQAVWEVYEPKIAELQQKQAALEANRQQLDESMASLDASIARLRAVIDLIDETIAPIRQFASLFRR